MIGTVVTCTQGSNTKVALAALLESSVLTTLVDVTTCAAIPHQAYFRCQPYQNFQSSNQF